MSGTVDALLAPLTFLPFFQLAAYHLTEELHLWHKHPLVAAFESVVSVLWSIYAAAHANRACFFCW